MFGANLDGSSCRSVAGVLADFRRFESRCQKGRRATIEGNMTMSHDSIDVHRMMLPNTSASSGSALLTRNNSQATYRSGLSGLKVSSPDECEQEQAQLTVTW